LLPKFLSVDIDLLPKDILHKTEHATASRRDIDPFVQCPTPLLPIAVHGDWKVYVGIVIDPIESKREATTSTSTTTKQTI